jgi:GH18 family chitinase
MLNKKLIILTSLLASSTSFAAVKDSNLTYSNTDFNSTQPGWSDTLTIYNNSSQPIVITHLQFETNYNTLDTSQLNGSIYHPATPAVPNKITDYDYQYSFSTESPYSKNTYTTIPANGSVTLTQLPLAHEQTAQNGIPVYYQPPFNIKITLQNGAVVTPTLKGQCQGAACNDPGQGKMIGAYYTDWANYHYTGNSQNMLMPNQIPLANMNTIYYDMGKIESQTANINFVDINHDQYYIPAFATLKQQYPYLNLIYSFGGWGDASSSSYPSYDLATIFDKQDPKLIQTLADNMVNMIRELGFNGIDIDYEWDAIQPNGNTMQLTPARVQGYQLLLQDIRCDLTKIQPSNNPHFYKLTSAVFAGPDSVQLFVTNGGDWSKVAAAVDYLDIMAYDMHGQFDVSATPPDNITGFLSNVQTSHAYTNKLFDRYTVVGAINAYTAQGVPASKIILGIPAYTRVEKSAVPITDDNKGMYLTLAPASTQPAGPSGSGGSVDYKCILNSSYCWGGFSFASSLNYVSANLTNQGLGALEKTPWAYDKSQNWFMSFDDGESANCKGHWTKQQKLAGVMIWEIDGDVPLTDANYKQNSIIYNVWQGLTNP